MKRLVDVYISWPTSCTRLRDALPCISLRCVAWLIIYYKIVMLHITDPNPLSVSPSEVQHICAKFTLRGFLR